MIDICLKHTLCKRDCLNELSKLIKRIEKIEGSIVECGVWKGGVSMWMAHCQKQYSQTRDIYLYDTFDGMTTPNNEKDSGRALKLFNSIREGKYKRGYDNWHKENKWAYAPLDLVKQNMESVRYDKGEIHYVVGDVLETLNETVPDKIALLRLDTDWYESTKKELEILFPKLVIGGFLIVDDYKCWEGSTLATDEFLKNNKEVKIINTRFGITFQKIGV